MFVLPQPAGYFFIFYLSLFSITNCGGGSGNSNEGTNINTAATIQSQTQGRVGGLWFGKYTSSLSDFEVNVTGIVTELGEVFFVYPENNRTSQVTEGRVTLNGKVIENVGLGVSGRIVSQAVEGFRYFNDTTTITTQLEGTVVEGQQLILKESYQGKPIGIFSLRYDNTYNNDSNITQFAGDYSSTNAQGIRISHKISNTGNLTGGNSLDCNYNGSVSLIDDFYNLYRVDMTISNCDNLNGKWHGYTMLSGGGNNLRSKVTFFIKSTTAVQSYSLERR